MNRLILFLIRLKFNVRKYEGFKFTNQKNNDIYYFTDTQLMKFSNGMTMPSKVSLNWLTDKNCKVEDDQGYFYWL